MLKLIVIFVAGLVIGAVWGWGAGIMSVLRSVKRVIPAQAGIRENKQCLK